MLFAITTPIVTSPNWAYPPWVYFSQLHRFRCQFSSTMLPPRG